MKAITLHQPWATLIALGLKHYETRSWPTTYRGNLAIHAGKTVIFDRQAMPLVAAALAAHGIHDAKQLPLGGVVCICKLKNVYHTEAVRPYLSADELAFGDFSDGRAAWDLEIVTVFSQPIRASGKQGLWDWAHHEQR